ncbi:hypothetical protein [Halochromatium sp.]
MTYLKLFGAAILAGVMVTSAFAQNAPANTPPAKDAESVAYDVYLQALGFADSILTSEQEATMEIIAYQAVVARVCTTYEMDYTRLAQAVATLDHVDKADLDAEQTAYAERLVMMSLGIAMGGMFAEFSMDPDAFCTNVDVLIDAMGEDALVSAK